MIADQQENVCSCLNNTEDKNISTEFYSFFVYFY